jgi:DNA-binding transcriptional LysR family regulator
MDELAGIRMFVRVVEGGSFVSAARRLGVSKSVITKHVKEPEDRLKAQLLVRSTRRLTPPVTSNDAPEWWRNWTRPSRRCAR